MIERLVKRRRVIASMLRFLFFALCDREWDKITRARFEKSLTHAVWWWCAAGDVAVALQQAGSADGVRALKHPMEGIIPRGSCPEAPYEGNHSPWFVP